MIHKKILSAIGTSYNLLQQKGLQKQTVQKILELLGEATEVDRIYIFRNNYNNEKELCMSYKLEWVAPGVSPQIDFSVLQNLPWSLFPEILHELQQNRIINDYIRNTKNEFFYETMSEQGIISYCFVPIIAKNLLWGYIGFDNCTKEALFSDAQCSALHAFASTLGTIILAKRSRNSLLRSRMKYFKLINSLEDVVFNLNDEGRITFVNESWEAFIGLSKSAVISHPLTDYVCGNHKDEILKILAELKEDPTARIEQEVKLRHHNGQKFWVFASFAVEMIGKYRNKHSFIGVFKKINEEKVVYKARPELEDIDNIRESVKDIIYAFLVENQEGVFVSDNVTHLGLDKKDFRSEGTLFEKVHPEDKAMVWENMTSFADKRKFDLSYRIINNRNEVIWVHDKAWVEKDRKGRDFKVYGRLTDITEIKENELKLKLSEERFRSITENIPMPLFIFNIEESRLFYSNQRFIDLIHPYLREDIKEVELNKLFRVPANQGISFILKENPIIREMEVILGDLFEDKKYFSLSSHRMPLDGNNMVVVVLKDITNRKKTEKRNIKLNELLQIINETQLRFFEQDEFDVPLEKLLQNIIALTDSKLGFMGEVLIDDNNNPYLKTYTYSSIYDSIEDKTFFEKQLRKSLEIYDSHLLFRETLNHGKVVISNDVANDDRIASPSSEHKFLNRFLGIPVHKGNEFLGMFGFANRDEPYTNSDIEFLKPIISGYANFIKAVRINREKKNADSMYRLISENTSEIIALHELDTTYRYVSPSLEKVLGYRPEEVIGKKPADVFGVTPFTFPNTPDIQIVYQKNKKGDQAVYLEIIRKILYDNEGKPESVLATARDVTDRENVLQDLKKSLIKEKELNHLKSRFISMTSHEFRTPLATIQTSAELIKMILENSQNQVGVNKVNAHIDRINSQIMRLNGIISDILILEKNSQEKIKLNQELFFVKKFILNIINENFVSHNKNEQIKLFLPKEDKVIYTDQTWLFHIVKNIIENAIKYSVGSPQVPELILTLKKSHLTISVRDYGIGIPEEDQKSIYESFFRAKNVSNIKGTGLGLSIVKEFIVLLGGSITLQSEQNKGTVFTLKFPYENRDTAN